MQNNFIYCYTVKYKTFIGMLDTKSQGHLPLGKGGGRVGLGKSS